MGIRIQTSTISCLLILIMSTQITVNVNSAELDITKIGVEPGDLFTYTILGFEFDISEDENEETDIENLIKTGDQVTLGVNTTIPVLGNDGNYSIILSLAIQDKLFGFNSSMQLENFIVFTDWDYWEEYAQTLRPNFLVDFFPTENPLYTVENGPDVFVIRADFVGVLEILWGGADIHKISEYHYDKATGVLLYASNFIEPKPDRKEDYFFFELTFAQNGYSGYTLPGHSWPSLSSTSSASIPLIVSMSGIFALYTIRKKGKRH